MAATFGTDVKVYTLMAFVVAGVFAGLGGALLAHNDTFVVRDLFNFQLALVFVIMTVVGGLRNRAGVVIGSAFFALVGYFFDEALQPAASTLPALKLLPEGVRPDRHRADAAAVHPHPPPRRDGPADPARCSAGCGAGGSASRTPTTTEVRVSDVRA